jgi:catechol 2,3-dioxygenase-like lactoylglutathione lyase family enzyme
MPITTFLHASLLVSDLQAAKIFYEEILGFAPASRNLSFPGLWYQIGAVQIHLIVSEEIIHDRVAPKWGRNRHLAFAVHDLATLRTRLETSGYSVQASSSGRAALFVADPDGNLLELAQA